MQKRTILAASFALGCALLAGCSDSVAPPTTPQQAPAEPQASATTVTTPVAPAPPQQATRQIVRGHLRFIDGYAAGVQAAAVQRKPMLLFFTASWCGYCHQLAAEAFTDEAVVKLSEQFVCVLIDADREPGVCQQFQVRGYPTIQFVSSRGQLLNRVIGKEPSHVLVRQMHAALQGLAAVNAAGTAAR
jgi:thiol:disulfide interchange protein